MFSKLRSVCANSLRDDEYYKLAKLHAAVNAATVSAASTAGYANNAVSNAKQVVRSVKRAERAKWAKFMKVFVQVALQVCVLVCLWRFNYASDSVVIIQVVLMLLLFNPRLPSTILEMLQNKLLLHIKAQLRTTFMADLICQTPVFHSFENALRSTLQSLTDTNHTPLYSFMRHTSYNVCFQIFLKILLPFVARFVCVLYSYSVFTIVFVITIWCICSPLSNKDNFVTPYQNPVLRFMQYIGHLSIGHPQLGEYKEDGYVNILSNEEAVIGSENNWNLFDVCKSHVSNCVSRWLSPKQS